MKIKAIFLVVILVLSLFLPIISLSNTEKAEVVPASGGFLVLDKGEATDYKSGNFKKFKILNTETNKILTLSAKDYIIGVVAAEMPALYEEEALKAQAVAAFSYAARKKLESKEKYDLTTDYTVNQSFLGKEELKAKWGGKYDTYYKRIEAAVEETLYEAVTFDGQIALTLYHAISSGKTESCADIFGGKLNYLSSVDSSFDTLAENYKTNVNLTPNEIKSKLSVSGEGDFKDWFGEIKRTSVGSVKKATVCGKELSGDKISSALGLRSRNFNVEYKDGKFSFTVLGYGHGVGMSQNGANQMAKSGSSYREILAHYYKGIKIEKV